jgi:hypothetical protein
MRLSSPKVFSEARVEVLRAFERSEKAPRFNPPLTDKKPDYTGYA